MSKERVHRFVSKDLTVRIAAVNATEVVRHMQDLQKTAPLATLAAGRSMTGALLMAANLKDDQLVGLLFRGDGPLGSVYAEASFNGHVRAYVSNPQYVPESYANGLSLTEAIGQGTLSVSRHQPFQKQPFHGTVELVSGEIGQDLAHYLQQSHQIRSLVSLGVYLDKDGKAEAAGGIIIEVMPGVDESVVELLQKNYDSKKPHVSKMLADGATVEDIVKPFLEGIPFEELDHNYDVEYFCPCTKDRVMRALETLPESELKDMIEKKEEVHVTCQICGRPYEVGVPEVQAIKDRLYKQSLH